MHTCKIAENPNGTLSTIDRRHDEEAAVRPPEGSPLARNPVRGRVSSKPVQDDIPPFRVEQEQLERWQCPSSEGEHPERAAGGPGATVLG